MTNNLMKIFKQKNRKRYKRIILIFFLIFLVFCCTCLRTEYYKNISFYDYERLTPVISQPNEILNYQIPDYPLIEYEPLVIKFDYSVFENNEPKIKNVYFLARYNANNSEISYAGGLTHLEPLQKLKIISKPNSTITDQQKFFKKISSYIDLMKYKFSGQKKLCQIDLFNSKLFTQSTNNICVMVSEKLKEKINLYDFLDGSKIMLGEKITNYVPVLKKYQHNLFLDIDDYILTEIEIIPASVLINGGFKERVGRKYTDFNKTINYSVYSTFFSKKDENIIFMFNENKNELWSGITPFMYKIDELFNQIDSIELDVLSQKTSDVLTEFFVKIAKEAKEKYGMDVNTADMIFVSGLMENRNYDFIKIGKKNCYELLNEQNNNRIESIYCLQEKDEFVEGSLITLGCNDELFSCHKLTNKELGDELFSFIEKLD